MKFGDIYISQLTSDERGIQTGKRPVLLVQNTIAGETVEVLPMTTKLKALHIPTHVVVKPTESNGLLSPSMVLAEQAVTINVGRLEKYVGEMDRCDLVRVGIAREKQSHFPK